jgi:hypothetical protein
VRGGDHELDQGLRRRIVRAQEGLVDLQGVDLELLQLDDTRVPGTEVVQTDGDSQRPQIPEVGVGGRLVQQHRLGDLDDQAGGLQAPGYQPVGGDQDGDDDRVPPLEGLPHG